MSLFQSTAITVVLLASQMSPARSQEPAGAAAAGVKNEAKDRGDRVDALGDPLPESAHLRLGTVRWSAGEPLTAAALSPDGKLFAVCGGRAIWLIDAATGERGRRIDTQAIGARAVAFSPDGATLVAAGYNQLSFWDVATGQKKPDADMKLQGGAMMTDLSFSADGRRLTAGTGFGQHTGLVVWDLDKKTTLGPYAAVHNRASAALAPDGKLLATWGNVLGGGRGEWDKTLQFWDVAAAKEVRQLKIETAPITAAAFAPDGKSLTVAGATTLTFFDVETWTPRRTLTTRRGLKHIAYSHDGTRLATITAEGVAEVWDVVKAARLGMCEADPGQVGFTKAGAALAWSTQGASLAVWEVPSGKRIAPLVGHQHPVAALSFSADGKTLVSAGQDGTVCAWDPASGKELRRVVIPDYDRSFVSRIGPRPQRSVSVAPDGVHVAIGGMMTEGTRVVDVTREKVLYDFDGSRSYGRDASLLFSPDGQILAVADDRQGHFRLWDMKTGQEIARVKLGPGAPAPGALSRVSAMAFAPDSKVLALLQGGEIQLVRCADGAELKRIAMGTPGRGLAFTPDGGAVAGAGGFVQLWDIETGKGLPPLATGGNTHAFAFAPDGSTLACATTVAGNPMQTSIVIVERATGGVRTSFKAGGQPVTQLAYAPDGKLLASASSDDGIILWDMTGRLASVRRAAAGRAPKQIDALWDALTASQADEAYPAMLDLFAAAADAVKLLGDKLKPATGWSGDRKSIERLIGELAADEFKVREQAATTLRQTGEIGIAMLQKAMAGALTLEQRRRIEVILSKMTRNPRSPEELRDLRAVEVLHWIGTPEARAVVRRLADGAAGAPLTRQARNALKGWPE